MVENVSSDSSFLSHSRTGDFTLSVETFQLGSRSATEKDCRSWQVRGSPGREEIIQNISVTFILSQQRVEGRYFSLLGCAFSKCLVA